MGREGDAAGFNPRYAGKRDAGFDDPLRMLELQVARMDERIVAMQENMATKNDMTGLKIWVIGSVFSAMAVASAILTIVVKVFL